MMFGYTRAINGFAVDDIPAAHRFYGDTLGIETSEHNGLLTLHLVGGRDTLVYQKPDFVPATYTILNFIVDDIDRAVDDLRARGISFERYEGLEQDERGVHRGYGPAIVWFTDPAGNILSAVQEE